MAEVKWIKIVTDMFDDEKILLIETLPEGDSILVIWLKLLCLAGKQNNSGVFMMQNGLPYTDKMLSIIFRRKDATVKLALSTFQSFGMIEIVEDAITIPNWGKHQNLDKIERNNEYMRGYMRDYRGRQKLIASGNEQENRKLNSKLNSNTNVSGADKNRIDKTKSNNAGEFEEFWKAYPKRECKKGALKKFQQIVKSGEATAGQLISGAMAYRKKVAGQNPKYTKQPTTWLNNGCWNDEAAEAIPENKTWRSEFDPLTPPANEWKPEF